MFRHPVGIQLFNRPEYAEKFLVSLSRQTLQVDQIKLHIFVDGYAGSIYESRGSADKSAEVTQLAIEYFPKAKVVKFDKNLGIAASHVQLQKLVFSNGSDWGAFFEEDVVLEPSYLEELSTLIEIVDDCERIGKVACFQILPPLSHLPRGHDGFYPGRGTKAFAERKTLFDKKLSMLESFVDILGKSDLEYFDTEKDSLRLAKLASRNSLGRLMPTMHHDIATDLFLEFNNFLHVVSKPFLAKDIGVHGVHNSIVPKIDIPLATHTNDMSENRNITFKNSIMLIEKESEDYALISYMKIINGYYISQSSKKMLKQILLNVFGRIRGILSF